MEKDIIEYFESKYKDAGFSVVPGDWPDFKTKEEVDLWINDMENQLNRLIAYAKSKKSNIERR